jgi:WD40 repeat protein
LSFNPREDYLLTAGLDRVANIYHVQKPKSKKMQSIYLPDLPVYSCKFINNGTQALFTGNRKHFYYFDLPSNSLEKISNIFGNNEISNLSKLFTPINSQSDYFAIA